jgi:hypothetical protein
MMSYSRLLRVAALVVLATLSVVTAASATGVLGTWTISGQMTEPGGGQLANPVVSAISFGPSNPFGSFDFIFMGKPLVEGATIWIRSIADDANFAKAVGYLTNGSNDYAYYQVSASIVGTGNARALASTTTESAGFVKPRIVGPDFSGCTITGLGLQVDKAAISGNTLDYQLKFLVDSTLVPEPGSILALLCGTVGLAGMITRRRR